MQWKSGYFWTLYSTYLGGFKILLQPILTSMYHAVNACCEWIFTKLQQVSFCQQWERFPACMHALRTPVFGKMSPRRIIEEALALLQQSGMLPNTHELTETFPVISEKGLWHMHFWHVADTTLTSCDDLMLCLLLILMIYHMINICQQCHHRILQQIIYPSYCVRITQ